MALVSPVDIYTWGAEYPTSPEIDGEWLVAIAKVESSLRPWVVNEISGAMGLFQFMPGTIEDIKIRFNYEFNPFDPKEATIAAKIYLSWLKDTVYTLDAILICWNWGIGNYRKYQRNEKELPEETKTFIERVKANLSESSGQSYLVLSEVLIISLILIAVVITT